MTVPPGYDWNTILRWGDPLFWNSPRVRPDAAQRRRAGTAVRLQQRLPRHPRPGPSRPSGPALLQSRVREPRRSCSRRRRPREELEVIKTTIAAHGLSVVELERNGRGRPWRYIRGARKNRRITAATPFRLTGPAAGSAYVRTAADPSGTKVYGTFGNCSGGTTPWGTILSGEENFNGYFIANPNGVGSKRYGLSKPSRAARPPTSGRRSIRASTPPSPATRTSRTGSATSSRSTPRIRRRPRASTRRWGGSSTRAPTSGSTGTAPWWPTWVTTSGSTTCTSSWPGGSSRPAIPPGPGAGTCGLLEQGDLYVAKFSGEQQPDDGDNLGTGEWAH